MRGLLLCLSLLAGGMTSSAGFAQEQQGINTPLIRTPILVVDFESAFAQSAFGRALNAALEQEGAAIVAQNRQIEAELTEEEQRLTEQRASMSPEEFRPLAEAFDEKVQRLRAEQDAKAEALRSRGDDSQIEFLRVARPILRELMSEASAAVVLERRSVLEAADAVDVTERVIARIDALVAAQNPAITPDATPEDTSDGTAPEAETVPTENPLDSTPLVTIPDSTAPETTGE